MIYVFLITLVLTLFLNYNLRRKKIIWKNNAKIIGDDLVKLLSSSNDIKRNNIYYLYNINEKRVLFIENFLKQYKILFIYGTVSLIFLAILNIFLITVIFI